MRGMGALLPFLSVTAAVVRADIDLVAMRHNIDHFLGHFGVVLRGMRDILWAIHLYVANSTKYA